MPAQAETANELDVHAVCDDLATRARGASRRLATTRGAARNEWLARAAGALRQRAEELLAANAQDLAAAPGYGLNAAAIDRLTLTPKRIDDMARALEEVVALPDPGGEVLSSSRRPNGLLVQQIRVPIGVILFLYESRPNVTADAAALCVKSGNAVILRGGQGSPALEPGHLPHPRRRARTLRPAGRRGAACRDHRPHGRGPAAGHGRSHRPGHPAPGVRA